MVDITPLIRSDQKVIQAYKNGVFKISNEIFTQPVIVFPDRVETWPVTPDQIILPETDDDTPPPVSAQTQITPALDGITFRAGEVELLLIGTGSIMHPLHPALRDAFKAHGMRIEAMDTGAAARTYNVLLAEGRRVAAALLLSN